MYIFKKIIGRRLMNRTASEQELAEHWELFQRAMHMIEARLSRNRYLCGDKVSIADLSAACELDQSRFVEYDFTGFPLTKAWHLKMID